MTASHDHIPRPLDHANGSGLSHSVAWHLAFLNDETLGGRTPEERYEKMLAWVRRAQGKEAVAA